MQGGFGFNQMHRAGFANRYSYSRFFHDKIQLGWALAGYDLNELWYRDIFTGDIRMDIALQLANERMTDEDMPSMCLGVDTIISKRVDHPHVHENGMKYVPLKREPCTSELCTVPMYIPGTSSFTDPQPGTSRDSLADTPASPDPQPGTSRDSLPDTPASPDPQPGTSHVDSSDDSKGIFF